VGWTVDNALDGDAVRPQKLGEVRGRMDGLEVALKAENSHNEEEPQGDQGTPGNSLDENQEEPETEEKGKKEHPSVQWQGETEMTDIESSGVGEKNRKEREFKLPFHLRSRKNWPGLLFALSGRASFQNFRIADHHNEGNVSRQ